MQGNRCICVAHRALEKYNTKPEAISACLLITGAASGVTNAFAIASARFDSRTRTGDSRFDYFQRKSTSCLPTASDRAVADSLTRRKLPVCWLKSLLLFSRAPAKNPPANRWWQPYLTGLGRILAGHDGAKSEISVKRYSAAARESGRMVRSFRMTTRTKPSRLSTLNQKPLTCFNCDKKHMKLNSLKISMSDSQIDSVRL